MEKGLKAYNDFLIEFEESNFDKHLKKQLLDIEELFYDDVVKILREMDTVSGVVQENDIVEIAARVDEALLRVADDAGFRVSVSAFMADFDKMEEQVILLHEVINGIKPASAIRERADSRLKFLADKTLYEMTEGGMRQYFVEQAKDVLFAASEFGYSITEAENLLREKIRTSKNLKNKTQYYRYASQVAADAVQGYAGQLNQIIADEYKMTKVRYIGRVIKTTRPFCRHVMSNLKGVIESRELTPLLKRFLSDPKLDNGMKPNTDKNNFLTLRGGYRCKHNAIPIR